MAAIRCLPILTLALILAACGSESTGPTIERVVITESAITVEVGQSVQLSARAVDAGGQTLAADFSWSSSTPAVATVNVNGLVTAVGPGTASISATAEGISGTTTITVSQLPEIVLSSTALAFTGQAGSSAPAPQGVNVTNGGGGAVEQLSTSITYGAGQTPGWLTAALSGTSAPTTLSLTASPTTLTPGTYTATVSVFAPGASNSPAPIQVSFMVTAPPRIELSNSSVTFNATLFEANPSSQAVEVTNVGAGNLTGLSATVRYGAGQPQGWLAPSLSPSTAPATLTLSVAIGTLPAGTYNATVDVTSSEADNSPQSVAVTFVVAAPAPVIQPSLKFVEFGGVEFGFNPPSQAVEIVNAYQNVAGAPPLTGLSYTVSPAAPWLTVSLNTTTAPATMTLSAATGFLAQGTYTTTIALSSPVASNNPVDVMVTFTIGADPCRIATGSVAPGNTVFGTLNAAGGDCVLFNGGATADLWVMQLGAQTSVNLDMLSSQFNAFLIVTRTIDDPTGPVSDIVASNDDGGSGTNAQIQATLPAGTYYIWTTSAALGETGDYSLTVDAIAPSLLSFFPASGQTRVRVEDVVTATFSQDMDPGSINASTFSVTGPTGPMPIAGSPASVGPVPGTVTYDMASRTATFTPDAPIRFHEFKSVYTVRIDGARDLAGTALSVNQWSFETVLFDLQYAYRLWNYKSGQGPNYAFGNASITPPFPCHTRYHEPTSVHPSPYEWYFTEVLTDRYRFNNVWSGDNLSLGANQFAPGTDMTCYMETTISPPNIRQLWSFTSLGNQQYQVNHELNPGLVLTVVGAGDAGVLVNGFNDGSQIWTFARLRRR